MGLYLSHLCHLYLALLDHSTKCVWSDFSKKGPQMVTLSRGGRDSWLHDFNQKQSQSSCYSLCWWRLLSSQDVTQPIRLTLIVGLEPSWLYWKYVSSSLCLTGQLCNPPIMAICSLYNWWNLLKHLHNQFPRVACASQLYTLRQLPI